MLPHEMMPTFEGAFPSVIVTGNAEGIPNVANLSRVWYVDAEHVAIANQMLGKTARNLAENPIALIKTVMPNSMLHWEITVKWSGSLEEGALFESVRQDLQAISWMAGISNPIGLRSVILFQVIACRKCVEESAPLAPLPEMYGDLLNTLSGELELSRLSFWELKDDGSKASLLASRGVPNAGANKAVFEPMKRLADLAQLENRVIRMRNIRSQMKYMHAAEDVSSPSAMPTSFLAFPVTAFGRTVGIVCCEETESPPQAFDRLEDGFLTLLGRRLGEALEEAAAIAESDRLPLLRQVMQHASLEWGKRTEPLFSLLSARERQVAMHVTKGYTNAEIAGLLFVSVRTVTTHVERIFQKLEINSRAALTRYVMEKGMLSDSPLDDRR